MHFGNPTVSMESFSGVIFPRTIRRIWFCLLSADSFQSLLEYARWPKFHLKQLRNLRFILHTWCKDPGTSPVDPLKRILAEMQFVCVVSCSTDHRNNGDKHTREVHELAVPVHKVAIFSRVPETPEILDRNRQFVDLPHL